MSQILHMYKGSNHKKKFFSPGLFFLWTVKEWGSHPESFFFQLCPLEWWKTVPTPSSRDWMVPYTHKVTLTSLSFNLICVTQSLCLFRFGASGVWQSVMICRILYTSHRSVCSFQTHLLPSRAWTEKLKETSYPLKLSSHDPPSPGAEMRPCPSDVRSGLQRLLELLILNTCPWK